MDTPIFAKFEKDNTFQLKLGERHLVKRSAIGKLVRNKYFEYKLHIINPDHYKRVESGEIEFYFQLNRPGTLASKYIKADGNQDSQ